MTLDEAIKHCEEVAKENEKFCFKKGGKGGYFNEDTDWNNRKCAEEHRQLARWLEELKQLKEQMSNSEKPNKWIPTSERLPEEDTAVLIWCPERKNIYCAYLEEKQWWIFGAYFEKVTLEVVAWMPLPHPFEPQESEGKK